MVAAAFGTEVRQIRQASEDPAAGDVEDLLDRLEQETCCCLTLARSPF